MSSTIPYFFLKKKATLLSIKVILYSAALITNAKDGTGTQRAAKAEQNKLLARLDERGSATDRANITGICIKKKNKGFDSSFVLKHVINNESIIQKFPLYSPFLIWEHNSSR